MLYICAMYSDKRSDERKLAGGDGREKKLVPQAKVFLPCRAVSLSSVSYSIFFLQLFPPSYILFLSCRTVPLSSFSYPLSFLQDCISFLLLISSFFLAGLYLFPPYHILFLFLVKRVKDTKFFKNH